MSQNEGDERSHTPRSQQFLNQWASMLSVMQATGSSTPLNDAFSSFYNPSQQQQQLQQQQYAQVCQATTVPSTTSQVYTSNTTSQIADFAENPPLFTCTFCPFIAMNAPSLEEHERMNHQNEINDPFLSSDDSSDNVMVSRELLMGFNSPQKKTNPPCSTQSNTSTNNRQFGRALQPGQIVEMQAHNLSTSPPSNSNTDQENAVFQFQAEGESKVSKKKQGNSRRGQFKCEFCDKVFGYQQNLNQHRRMHTGEKYKCNICSKEFNFSQNLHQHMRVHSGKKEYKCPFCCKEFNDAANFHRHKRVIHGITGKNKNETPKNVTANPHPHMKNLDQGEDELAVSMPFTCPRCAMCFVLDSSLQKHLQHCVSPTKDEPDESSDSSSKSSPKTESVKSDAQVIKQEKQGSKQTNNGGRKRKRESNESNVSKRSRSSLENQENVQSEFQSCAYNNMPQNQPEISPSYPSSYNSPSFQTPSPAAHQNHSGHLSSSPGSSPTQPPSTGYIFVCPYCGFGVTNNLVFREHLMHHRESICHQYQRVLSQGQSSFEVIINRIMISCMQVINPTTVASPLSSSGSNQSSPVTSPKHNDQGMIQNQLMLQQQHQYQQQHPQQYYPFMHPAYLNPHPQMMNPAPQQPAMNYQPIHYSPPGNIKQEMNDSGCVVEGEVSPWRLMNDSFRMRQYNQ